MTKKEPTQNEITETENGYIFPDGELIGRDEIIETANLSSLSSVEKSGLEAITGKPFKLIIAEGIHQRRTEEHAKQSVKEAAYKAAMEAERTAEINAGKKHAANLMTVIYDGEILPADKQPKLSDEDYIQLSGLIPAYLSGTHTDAVKYAIEIRYLTDKFPGHRFIFTAAD